MLTRTHFVFNLFIFLLLLNFNILQSSWIILLIFFIATFLPDIDIAGSFISKRTKPLSNFLHTLVEHREEFHSLLFTISLSLIVFLISRNLLFAGTFFFFYFLHLLLDSFTVSGIKWFWPLKFKTKGFIKTGKISEAILFMIFSLASLFVLLMIL